MTNETMSTINLPDKYEIETAMRGHRDLAG